MNFHVLASFAAMLWRAIVVALVLVVALVSYKAAMLISRPRSGDYLRGQWNYTDQVRRQALASRIGKQTVVMLGDSQEDVGFDVSTKVAVLQRIAARNVEIFPALKEATIVRMWAALRVMSPDGFPIYEQSERFPGAFAATCHSGVTLAGSHALALAPAILEGELPEALAAFSSQRFAAAA